MLSHPSQGVFDGAAVDNLFLRNGDHDSDARNPVFVKGLGLSLLKM